MKKNLNELQQIIIRVVESAAKIKPEQDWNEFIAISPEYKEYAEAFNELREYAEGLKEAV